MVSQICSLELKSNNANHFDIYTSFLDFGFSINNSTVSSKIDQKREDFNFEIVTSNFWIMVNDNVPILMEYIFHKLFVLKERVCN